MRVKGNRDFIFNILIYRFVRESQSKVTSHRSPQEVNVLSPAHSDWRGTEGVSVCLVCVWPCT